VVGERVTLSVELEAGPTNSNAFLVEWNVGTLNQQGSDLCFRFIPQAAGPVVATVSVKMADYAESITRRLTVRPAPLSRVDFQKVATRAQGLQTLLAGCLIVGAGLVLFHDWTGTLADVFAVLFWGFAADVGVASVLSYAEPLKQKKVLGT
jgi:hypothetical protein